VEIQANLSHWAQAQPEGVFTMKLTKKATATRRARRTHNPEFKARVALAALREDKTLAQLCEEFDLHVNQITEWRRQLVERAAQAFNGAALEPATDLVPLHAKIGQLTLENDFLERALTKAGLLSGAR
jgi:transposase-like protein